MKKQITCLFLALMIIFCLCVPTVNSLAQPTIVVSSVSGEAGETVTVDILLENNPGLASLILNIEYDKALTLTNVTFSSTFGAYTTAPEPYKNPQRLAMMSPLQNISANGVFATLTFKISEDAVAGEYKITVSYNESDIFDSEFDPIAIAIKNGSVIVTPTAISGDINTDGEIDETDAATILKHITGHDVEVDEEAADINGDGEVNIRDAAMILLYLNGKIDSLN